MYTTHVYRLKDRSVGSIAMKEMSIESDMSIESHVYRVTCL